MKSLLLIGASGFLGRNIHRGLSDKYRITTCGKNPRNIVCADLRHTIPLLPGRPDIVVHACGEAHYVPRTLAEEHRFYEVNHQGTINICRALENTGIPDTFIYISSVAVYGESSGEDIDENHPLAGSSAYARSKILAEQYLRDWAARNGCHLVILRSALVVGQNPPGNMRDMINGISSGKYFSINKGMARKSLFLVDDFARLIPLLEGRDGTYNLCADYHPAFAELEALIASQMGRRQPYNIPLKLARTMARIGDFMGRYAPINTARLEKITSTLTFSNRTLHRDINFTPTPILEGFHI